MPINCPVDNYCTEPNKKDSCDKVKVTRLHARKHITQYSRFYTLCTTSCVCTYFMRSQMWEPLAGAESTYYGGPDYVHSLS